MKQETIDFDELYRASDPSTSREAAEHLKGTDRVGEMIRTALRLLEQFPNSTAKELEKIAGYEDGQIRKRLGDARKLDLVEIGDPRKCHITGRRSQTWRLKRKQPSEPSQPEMFRQYDVRAFQR